MELLGVIIIFIIVLVCCYFTTKLVASRQLKQKNTGNFEVIETYSVAKDRYLQLVRIGERYFATSVCKDSIQVLTEVSKDEIVFSTPGTGLSVNGFADILNKLVRKNENDSNDDLSSGE